MNAHATATRRPQPSGSNEPAGRANLIVPGMGGDHCAGIVFRSIRLLQAIPIAAMGLLHPMIGVIAMTASSLSVIGNSMLLQRAKLTVDR